MKLRYALFAFSLAFAGTAQAQGYIGGSLGQANANVDTGALDSEATALGFGHTGFSADESDTGWKLFAGYRFNRNFAVEGGFVSLGEISARTTVTSVGGTPVIPGSLVLSAETDPGFFGSAVGIAPINDRFSLFGKIGLFSIKTTGKLTATGSAGTASESSSGTATELLFGLGVSYDFNMNFGIRAEWERFTDVGDEDSVGTGDVDLMSIGLVYRF